jgi:asparagine synthase (glutamine-hydrolysing)
MAGDLLEGAMRRLWPQEGDAGLLLSGGVDSATILVGARKMLDRPIRSFTFRYEDYEGRFNEGGRAAAIAAHLGSTHEEIPIRPEDILSDLPAAVASYDEPFTWGLHSYRLAPLAERGIGTVFNGTGADGWSLSKRHRAALRFYGLPSAVRTVTRVAVHAARPLNLGSQKQAEWTTRPISGIGEMYSPDSEWSRLSRQRLYVDPTLAERGTRTLASVYVDAADEYASMEPERAIVWLDKRFNSAEQMVHWNRSWSNAAGLTLCLPYYDHDLLDLAMNVEGETTGKDLLRQIAARYLPSEMAEARKIPQQMPIGEWIRGPLRGAVRDRLGDLPGTMQEIFAQKGVLDLLDDHESGGADHGWKLIALLTTATWFEQIPGAEN